MDYLKRLKQILKERNLRWIDIAAKLKIPQQTLSYRINRSDLKIDTLEQICKVLNIDIVNLFMTKDEIAKLFKLSPEAYTAAKAIDLLPTEIKAAALSMINGLIENLNNKTSQT